MLESIDLCHMLARHIAGVRYQDLPAVAADAARKSILDTIGVTLAASGMEPAVRGVADLVRETGWRPACSVLGFGGRAPTAMAAFANGVLAHALDFEDQAMERPSRQLGRAGSVGSGRAQRRRLGAAPDRAVALDQDMYVRLRCNVGWWQGGNLSSVIGAFSATAEASYLMGLDATRVAHTLGIASMQSSGTMKVYP